MIRNFEGKVALITGGAGGIGGATAQMLAEAGARLALVDNSPERLDQCRDSYPETLPLLADVTDLAAMDEACAAIETKFGRLDMVINVAGGGLPRSIDTMTAEDWQRTIALNLTGPFNVIKATTPALRRTGGGSIVIVASLAALGISLNSGVSYTAAKAGLLGLTRHCAYELASDGIRVNAVLPGAILTDQMKNKISRDAYESIPMKSAMQRWISPEEIAGPILFFCSDASSACTGTHLLVDAGWMINGPEDREAYFAQRRPR
ncbi:SDR family NAD(P)-dependent oxidoreductase [Sphingomonas bisphenolicum]|uniref:Short-chain dehydrogenase n=1 Tax=Sphingomonas bisphenolicum TaxID=296544 RepID=A0ABM7G4Z6_9SPHN|nr:SDR family oxidoreductase [Sphingomonas bisphenolicum]BBF69786.1 short-chain dehydrogenase [Sphingomonas bisphenolicum]